MSTSTKTDPAVNSDVERFTQAVNEGKDHLACAHATVILAETGPLGEEKGLSKTTSAGFVAASLNRLISQTRGNRIHPPRFPKTRMLIWETLVEAWVWADDHNRDYFGRLIAEGPTGLYDKERHNAFELLRNILDSMEPRICLPKVYDFLANSEPTDNSDVLQRMGTKLGRVPQAELQLMAVARRCVPEEWPFCDILTVALPELISKNHRILELAEAGISIGCHMPGDHRYKVSIPSEIVTLKKVINRIGSEDEIQAIETIEDPELERTLERDLKHAKSWRVRHPKIPSFTLHLVIESHNVATGETIKTRQRDIVLK